MDLAVSNQMEGYPSFVRRTDENPTSIDWWAPVRIGDAHSDYATGAAHCDAAIAMLKGLHDPYAIDFYKAVVAPIYGDPRAILAKIVHSMRVSGPMECGFIWALTQKAIAGRPPAVGYGLLDDDRFGQETAQACIEIARCTCDPSLLSGELIATIDRTFDITLQQAFVWTVCASALAGASN